MIAVADLVVTATTRTTARTTALTRAYPAVGSEGVANTYAMAKPELTSALIEATTTRRTTARVTVTLSLLFSIGRRLCLRRVLAADVQQAVEVTGGRHDPDLTCRDACTAVSAWHLRMD